MSLRPLALSVLAAAFAYAPPALAADFAPPPRVAPAPPPLMVQHSGFYFGGRQGIGSAKDTRFSTDDGDTSFKTKYDPVLRSGLVLGYSFGPILGALTPRVELEGGYSNVSVKSHSVTQGGISLAPGSTDSFGDLRSTTGLVNGYLDLNLGQVSGVRPDHLLWRIKPFIGAGIGVSQVTLRRQGITDTGVVMDASDTRMTWHVSAGVGYQLWENITVELGVRHIRTEGLSFTARDGTTSKTDAINNLVTFGIRRSF
jgi:opacity protein-like surface antigen